MYTMTETEMSNIVVMQKDMILRLINDGHLRRAQACLDVLSPLWERVDYDYKREELQRRINLEIYSLD